jgi:hypothetical protein
MRPRCGVWGLGLRGLEGVDGFRGGEVLREANLGGSCEGKTSGEVEVLFVHTSLLPLRKRP